jgi:uncharacterized protein (TIGR00725 family)
MNQRTVVGILGPGRCTPEQARRAEALGAAFALRGAVVATGGLGGVMEAASRGADGAGGLVLGILPGPDARAANPHVHIAVATGLGEARNLVLVHSAHVLVAVGGALGTLSEIALALKAGRPVVGLDTWPIDPALSGGAVPLAARDVDEAVRLALAAAEAAAT